MPEPTPEPAKKPEPAQPEPSSPSTPKKQESKEEEENLETPKGIPKKGIPSGFVIKKRFGTEGIAQYNDLWKKTEISSISVYTDDDRLQGVLITYKNNTKSPLYGSAKGKEQIVQLADQEFITKIEAKHDNKVLLGIAFTMTTGRVEGFFGAKKAKNTTAIPHYKCRLASFLCCITKENTIGGLFCIFDANTKQVAAASTTIASKEYVECGPFGGKGGNAFTDDASVWDSGRIKQIILSCSNVITLVQLVYENEKGVEVDGSEHGVYSASKQVITLAADEYITQVSGMAGALIDGIQFESNKRKFPFFGGNGGKAWQAIPQNDLSLGAKLKTIKGRCGSAMDQLKFVFEKGSSSAAVAANKSSKSEQKQQEPEVKVKKASAPASSAPPQQPTMLAAKLESTSFGGKGGTPFDDKLWSAGGNLSYITVWHSNVIHGLKFGYTNGQSSIFGDSKEAQKNATFYIPQGERIVRVEARNGAIVDGFTLVTDKGTRSQTYGGNGGAPSVHEVTGKYVMGITGRAGARVDQITLWWANK